MSYEVRRSDEFSRALRKLNNQEFFNQLDKKIPRLKENPYSVGGRLSGKYHGYFDFRLLRKYRVIFSIDEENKIVKLHTIEHRDHAY